MGVYSKQKEQNKPQWVYIKYYITLNYIFLSGETPQEHVKFSL